MTQNAKLLVYLESHDGITTLEAMSALKICRLSERIRELETLGFRFRHDQETTPHGARVTRYRLQKAAEQSSTASLASGASNEALRQGEIASAAPSRLDPVLVNYGPRKGNPVECAFVVEGYRAGCAPWER